MRERVREREKMRGRERVRRQREGIDGARSQYERMKKGEEESELKDLLIGRHRA